MAGGQGGADNYRRNGGTGGTGYAGNSGNSGQAASQGGGGGSGGGGGGAGGGTGGIGGAEFSAGGTGGRTGPGGAGGTTPGGDGGNAPTPPSTIQEGVNVTGAGGGGGGGGAHGLDTAGTMAEFANQVDLKGGVGGAGGTQGGPSGGGGGGGAGGYGAVVRTAGTSSNSASVTGGKGGAGGGSTQGAGGDGGAGGVGGLFTAATTLNNSGKFQGGAGGVGGGQGGSGHSGALGGGGGAGGAGLSFASTFTLNAIAGSITGGDGGSGGDGGGDSYHSQNGNGGVGGVGIDGADGGAINNTVIVTGGNGGAAGTFTSGPAGAPGLGAAGVLGSNLTITNNGAISGGLANAGATGAARADAIDFTGGTNSLTITSTSIITGNVVAFSTVDTFGLGGDATPGTSFDLAQFGSANSTTAQYRGFGNLLKSGASTWTLTGAPGATVAYAVSAGTLDLGGTSQTANGLTLTGGTLSNGILTSSAAFAVRAGTVSATLAGGGILTKSTAGAVVLSGANTYSGGTTLNAGTLDLNVATVLNGAAITSGGAGTGGIAFGTTTPATLKIEAAAFNTTGSTSHLAYKLTDFMLGDAIDLANLNAGGATASYSGTTLVVSGTAFGGATAASDTLTINQAPSGYQYAITDDGAAHALVTLQAIPAAPSNGGGTSSTPPVVTPTPVVAPPASNPPTNDTPAPAIPPAVAFDPAVTTLGSTVTLTGTASAGASVTGVDILEDGAKIGSATVTGGAWSYDFNQPAGFHTDITAVATDSQNLQASAPSHYDLTTGITGEPYKTQQDSYDPASYAYEGSTFFKQGGGVYLHESYTVLPAGGETYTYDAGSFFRGKAYSSFADSYNADGTLVEHVENNRDGSHSIEVDGVHQFIQGLGADTFAANGTSTRFVIDHGVGRELITGFQVAGAGHDIVSLPNSDAGRLANILAHATGDGQGDTTIKLGQGDTITFVGVSVAQLQKHAVDFVFHA